MNKGRNDNLPRICLTEMEEDLTSSKVNRAGVNFLVRFTSLSESAPVFLFSNPNMEIRGLLGSYSFLTSNCQ